MNPPTRGFSKMPGNAELAALPFRRQRRLAGGAGDGPQPGTLDRAHRSGRAGGDHQDPADAASFLWPDGSPARPAASLCICPSAGPGKTSSVAPWHDSARCLSRPDGARPPLTQPPRQLAPGPVRECVLPCPIPPSRSPQPLQAAIGAPNSAGRPPANLQSTRIRVRTVASVTSSPPPPLSLRRPSVDSG